MSPTDGVYLAHVNLEVTNLARARTFYDRVLPLLGFRRLPLSDAAWLGYRKRRMTLWITVSRPARTSRHAPHAPTNGATDPISDHLGFRVPSSKRVKEIEATLRGRGLTPVYGLDKVATTGKSWYVSCAFRDPDNNVVEIYTVASRRGH